MDTREDDETARCDWCGIAVPDDGWVGLEVQRPVDVPGREDGWVDYAGGFFCSQEHAALWLAKPLPPPEPPTVLKEERVDWILLATTAVALVAAGLACVGLWTIVQWVVR
ncbi:hypothetical protein [Puerhibacterium puerhi]|uniref:hypothetical protein n=1 Tax=Puerhibacterium puerhi TaxID=2692623 RepID=UPI001359B83C|nr:hypothetical protein [Puerhibacterium puerhi]